MSLDTKQLLYKADKALEKHDYVRAIELYCNVLMEDRTILTAQYKLGKALQKHQENEGKGRDAVYLDHPLTHANDIRLAYELFKLQIRALGYATSCVVNGMVTYYERTGEPASAAMNCKTLQREFEREGKPLLAKAAAERLEKNIQALHQKARNDEKAGDFRFAFNSYRALLGYDFNRYDYHFGYLANALKSGKPEEAYTTILKNRAHKKYVQENKVLWQLFSELAGMVLPEVDCRGTHH